MDLQELVAGDTLDFTTTAEGYPPSDGWTLQYRLNPRFATPAQPGITLTAVTLDESTYRLTASPSATANWVPGVYGWAAWVTNGSHRITLERGGELNVTPNPATQAQGVDSRSFFEVALANINAMLAGKAASGVAEYTVNGRQLKSYPLPDLLRLKREFETEVNRERAAKGLPTIGGRHRILMRCA